MASSAALERCAHKANHIVLALGLAEPCLWPVSFTCNLFCTTLSLSLTLSLTPILLASPGSPPSPPKSSPHGGLWPVSSRKCNISLHHLGVSRAVRTCDCSQSFWIAVQPPCAPSIPVLSRLATLFCKYTSLSAHISDALPLILLSSPLLHFPTFCGGSLFSFPHRGWRHSALPVISIGCRSSIDKTLAFE
ncbi:hypothetical protein BGZ57DRAFT_173207 [Hyaloscypha finlandica]|nr:hypothetical protein BGZ57DRAFT_173207 [Hyaloscypha finlandica]